MFFVTLLLTCLSSGLSIAQERPQPVRTQVDTCTLVRNLANGRSRMNSSGLMTVSINRGNATEFYTVGNGRCTRFASIPVAAEAVAFNNDGSLAYLLYNRSWKGALLSGIDLRSGKVLGTARVPAKTVSISVGAGDSILALASGATIKIYDPKSLRKGQVFWEASKQQQVVFNPVIASQLASINTANAIQVRDLATDRIIMEISAHRAPVIWLQYDPTGKMLASYDNQGKLFVWNLETRALLVEMEGQPGVPSFSNTGLLYWDNGSFRRELDPLNPVGEGLKTGNTNLSWFNKNTQKRVRIYPQPVIAYTPETGLLAGAAANILISPKAPRKDPRNNMPSSLAPAITYGFGGKQLNSGLTAEIFTRNGWQFNGNLGYNVNERNFYFGNGSVRDKHNRDAYTNDAFLFNGIILKQVARHIRAGAAYNIRHNTRSKFDTGFAADPMFRGGWLVGGGPAIQLDFRDDMLFPTRGSLFDAGISWYGGSIGSDYDYTELILNYRKYIPLAFGRSRKVLALQGLVHTTWNGAPPFYQQPYLGADRVLRGVFRNLYIYPQVAMVQAEYRSLIIPRDTRYGYVVFAGAGDGADNFFERYDPDLKLVYGAGYRQQLLPKLRIDLRFDLSMTNKGNFGVYGGFGVAF